MKQRILFVGRGAFFEDAAGHQALALMERQQDFMRHGYYFDFIHWTTDLERVVSATRQSYDSVFITFHWQDSVEQVVAALKQIRQVQSAKLYFVDWYDQTCSPHWSALPYVDGYFKPCLLRDMACYQHSFSGGYIVTDFLEKQLGYDLQGYMFSSPLPQEHAHKISLVGNIASLERYERLLKWGMRYSLRFRFRPIDVNCRFTVGKFQGSNSWYTKCRSAALERIRSVKGVRLSGNGRLDFRRYLLETAFSKIVFSPFGWGEVCYRDYEAICCGALLVKPTMEHMRTEPNIYYPFETYVPVRWDLSDLEEKCLYYLNHPAEAQAIIQNATKVYRAFYEEKRYISLIERALIKNGTHGTHE